MNRCGIVVLVAVVFWDKFYLVSLESCQNKRQLVSRFSNCGNHDQPDLTYIVKIEKNLKANLLKFT